MLFFDHIRRGALGAAMTLVLALADGCPATWKLDFDELEPGTGLGTKWDAFGFHFVNGPLFEGLPGGALPTAVVNPLPPASAGKVLQLHPVSYGEWRPTNSLSCRLDNPARRVQVTVGNFGSSARVQLWAYTLDGSILRVERNVPAGSAVTTVLSLKSEGYEITAFTLHAMGGVILMDDLIIEDLR